MSSSLQEIPAAPHVSGPRYQMLDVWRGVVAIVVVLEHVGVVLWGASLDGATGWERQFFKGVIWALQLDVGGILFFVMSGFCIASSLASAQRRGDTPLRFLYRRFWRIFPTYWAALLLFVAFVSASDAVGLRMLHDNGVSLQLASPWSLTHAQWFGNLTLTETWRTHFVGGLTSAVYTRVAWSLCYQEQFYALCALALWFFPNRLAKFMAIATVAIASLRFAASDVGWLERFSGSLIIFWHVFAVGLAVYWRLLGSAGVAMNRRRLVEIGMAVLAVATWFVTHHLPNVVPYLFGLALIGLYRWDAKGAALRCLEPIRACGRRSYSIYLVHLPVTTIGNGLLVAAGIESTWGRALVIMPVVTAASVGFGWAFHAAVERHFLGLPPRIDGRRFRPDRWRRGSFQLGGSTVKTA